MNLVNLFQGLRLDFNLFCITNYMLPNTPNICSLSSLLLKRSKNDQKKAKKCQKVNFGTHYFLVVIYLIEKHLKCSYRR